MSMHEMTLDPVWKGVDMHEMTWDPARKGVYMHEMTWQLVASLSSMIPHCVIISHVQL